MTTTYLVMLMECMVHFEPTKCIPNATATSDHHKVHYCAMSISLVLFLTYLSQTVTEK